jgi:hypothetical protein
MQRSDGDRRIKRTRKTKWAVVNEWAFSDLATNNRGRPPDIEGVEAIASLVGILYTGVYTENIPLSVELRIKRRF